MYSCTNTLEQFDHNPSFLAKHIYWFFIDIVVNKLVVFGSWVALNPSSFYEILIGRILHDQLMFVSDSPNNAFVFANTKFFISYNGDVLELVHTPLWLSFIVCLCCSHLQHFSV